MLTTFDACPATRICPVCQAEGKTSCTHLAVDKAPWKSGGKREIVEALYGANKVLANRELQGLVQDDMHSAYNRRIVLATFDAPRIKSATYKPKVIYIAIDPNGGGASKFSMTSLSLYQLGTRIGDTIQAQGTSDSNTKKARIEDPSKQQNPVGFIIHGLENAGCTSRDQIWITVISQIRNLRKIYPASSTLIVVGTENNLGNEASHITHMLRSEENLICLAEGKNDKAGFCTTNARKHEYFSLLEVALHEGCIHFMDNLVSHDSESCMLDLKTQMLAFKRVATNDRSAFSQPKVTYSGKIDG